MKKYTKTVRKTDRLNIKINAVSYALLYGVCELQVQLFISVCVQNQLELHYAE